jgi:flagella basal body P-ring formation protein FlgA
MLDGTHVHVRLSVICLENGAQGQMIRAASQDHQLMFRVKVAGDGTLEGRL